MRAVDRSCDQDPRKGYLLVWPGYHCEPQYGYLHYHTEVAGQSKTAIQASGDERTRQRADRRGDDICRGFQESKDHGSTHCGVVLAVDEALNSVLDDNHLLMMLKGPIRRLKR